MITLYDEYTNAIETYRKMCDIMNINGTHIDSGFLGIYCEPFSDYFGTILTSVYTPNPRNNEELLDEFEIKYKTKEYDCWPSDTAINEIQYRIISIAWPEALDVMRDLKKREMICRGKVILSQDMFWVHDVIKGKLHIFKFNKNGNRIHNIHYVDPMKFYRNRTEYCRQSAFELDDNENDGDGCTFCNSSKSPIGLDVYKRFALPQSTITITVPPNYAVFVKVRKFKKGYRQKNVFACVPFDKVYDKEGRFLIKRKDFKYHH